MGHFSVFFFTSCLVLISWSLTDSGKQVGFDLVMRQEAGLFRQSELSVVLQTLASHLYSDVMKFVLVRMVDLSSGGLLLDSVNEHCI